jgi:hypothetical protein
VIVVWAAALGAPLPSPDVFVRWFGVAAFAGAVGCAVAWLVTLASTWCADVAVLSVMLVLARRSAAGAVDAVAGAEVYAG